MKFFCPKCHEWREGEAAEERNFGGIIFARPQDRWAGSEKYVRCGECEELFHRAVLKRRPGEAGPADALAALAGDSPREEPPADSDANTPHADATSSTSTRVVAPRYTLSQRRRNRLIVGIIATVIVILLLILRHFV